MRSAGAAAALPSSGSAEKGDLQVQPPGAEPADHALGRSRGGLSTKVHLSCEQRQKPLSVVITAGQRGDSPQFETVLGGIAVPRPGPGWPRTRPDRVLGDKAYSSAANRAYLRRRGIRCTIPEPTDQIRNRKNRGRAGGRPPATGSRGAEAEALNGAGEASLATGQPAQARARHTAALTLAAETGNRYQQARAHYGLAACDAVGEIEQMRQHWQHALDIYTELGVPEAAQMRAASGSVAHNPSR